jgi:hypothetical protein
MNIYRRQRLNFTYTLPEGWSMFLYGNEPVHVVIMTDAGDIVTWAVSAGDMVIRTEQLDDEPWEYDSVEAGISLYIATLVGLELADMRMYGLNQLNTTRGSDVSRIA